VERGAGRQGRRAARTPAVEGYDPPRHARPWDLQYGTIAVRARIRSRNPEAKARIRLLPVTERLGAWPDSGDLFLMDYDGSRPGAVACGATRCR